MRKGIFALVFACGLGSVALAGCDDDETPNKADVGVTDAAVTDSGAAGSDGSAGPDGAAGAGGSGGADAAIADASDDSAVVGDGPAADVGATPDGPVTSECFSGTPVNNLDFLNSCPPTGVVAAPDKVVTLPGGLKVGDPLPAL